MKPPDMRAVRAVCRKAEAAADRGAPRLHLYVVATSPWERERVYGAVSSEHASLLHTQRSMRGEP